MSNLSGISYVRNLGSKIGEAILDAFSYAQRVIMYTHSQIHEGCAYEIPGVNGEDIADDATLLIQFKTPATDKVHLKNLSAWTDGGLAQLEILENPTFTTGTTGLTPINKERNSGFASGVIAFNDPTGISGGVVIKDILFGGGSGGNANGGAINVDIEDVLKIDTTYIIQLTNLSGGTADMNLLPFWYEAE